METLRVLQDLAKTCREQETLFLIVGGWALNAHGVSRQTLDVDLLIQDSSLPAVEQILSMHGYAKVYEADLFAKFRAEDPTLMDIDCLLTDARTVGKMLSESLTTKMGGVDFTVPSLSHLIAMKLHALKHNAHRRYERDLPDIVALVRVNNLDVRGDDFKDLCLSFGTPELHRDIVMAACSES